MYSTEEDRNCCASGAQMHFTSRRTPIRLDVLREHKHCIRAEELIQYLEI